MAKHLLKSLIFGSAACLALSLMAGPALAAKPDKLRFCTMLSVGKEAQWDLSWLEAYERVKAKSLHGLELTVNTVENLWGNDAETGMRLFAESGECDIIWVHSQLSDQLEKVKKDFPDILYALAGSGNRAFGGNVYFYYSRLHEAGYLMGMLAGKMSKNNVMGVVGTFPAPDVNDYVNAFLKGAKDVNPKMKQKVVFLETWYDPPKFAEAVEAQIALGADMILMNGSVFKPCAEAKIWCFGKNRDENYLAPKGVATSSMMYWDPAITDIINVWWAHETQNKPYRGYKKPRWYTFAEGGTDIAPYHSFDAKIPDDVKALIDETKAKIRSGKLVIPVDMATPVSD